MITKKIRIALSAISLFSTVFVASTGIHAAPVRFSQVTQVVDAKPGKANSGNYTRIRLANDPVNDPVNDPAKEGKTDNSGVRPPQQDDRVITETSFEIVEAEECECIPDKEKGGFPYWTLLGLAAIPIAIVLTRDDDDPTPTPTPPTTMTPTPTPTPTPTMTPTPTPTPPKTPTPTPPTEPVPEPMTILLFGTGLAGVGLAARRKFGKREDEEESEE